MPTAMSKIAFPTAFALTLVLAGSSHASDGSYEVSKTDASLTAGTKGKASVTISAKKGWHLNAEAPLTLKLLPAAGVEVDKTKLGRGDLAASNDTSARFDIALTAAEPGKKTVEAEAGFVLCQEDSCRPVKEKITLAVEVTSPPAATAKRPGKKK
jgi:DsbC/DsbD-like thiol-disulfide interchange protein